MSSFSTRYSRLRSASLLALWPCSALLVFLGPLALTAGCSSDKTSLLVEVTSDLEVPGQLDALEVIVTGDVAASMVERVYELSAPWPHTISLRPGQVESQGVVIEITAQFGGEFVARRVVRSAFVRGEQVVVRVHFPASCTAVVCAPGEDCRDGACAPVDARDAGPMDSGVDTSVDTGVRDSGVRDTGCTSAAACDDFVACTLDLCEDGVCRNEPDDSLCVAGTTCDLATGCPPRSCSEDAECVDAVMCNGMEVCDATMCTSGPSTDCNDGEACTSDQCDEAMRGMCVHTTRDLDRDGFGDATCPEAGGVLATDCNDSNPEVNPSSPEICNGIDDDCAGGCDDTFTCCRGEVGPCTTSCGTAGSRVCTGTCSWDVCAPPPEVCNGVDDDCNGAPDDVFACVQGSSQSCTTACGTTGTRSCQSDCSWGACTPPTEVCNGLDDDCDGTPDEGFACTQGTSTSCTTTCGSTGTRTCSAACALGACVPPAEGCSGVDDDCDGMIDETSECTPGAMGACTTSCGTMGTRSCGASCTFGMCMPPAEVCNGVDDDCDGSIDETSTCIPGTTGSCSTSCGTTGLRTCDAACSWGACAAPIEACNGVDDNCDGSCDEAFLCCAGSSEACMTSCGSAGTRVCSAACGWSVCSVPAEVCNGVDDDCDGTCDEGSTCCAGTTQNCTTTCGTLGSRTCDSGCAWGTCDVPAEVCNGRDDDCDTMVDEGFACTPTERGPCTTSCGTVGSRVCGASCTWGACILPPELCNGVDDDCDTMVDESCVSCPVFGNDTFGYVGCEDTAVGPSPCPDIRLTGTPVTLTDDSSVSVPIGFDFDFYGMNYTTGFLQSNGGFSFGTSSFTYSNRCLPYTSAPTFIAAFWDDLNPAAGDTIAYQTMGVAPNRSFVVHWEISHYSTSPTPGDFRMVLFEGSNDIRVCYVDTNFGIASYDEGFSATAGLQGDATTNYLQYSCNARVLTDGLVLDYIHP